MFYPDKKPHISPSAFAQWHHGKSQFIRSYFRGEKSPETTAMKAGKRIHGLIEGGLLPVKYRFNVNEVDAIIELPNGVKVLGRPDSYEVAPNEEDVSFVDYKTGKENHWTRDILAVDLKMRLTAWLVLKKNPGARRVWGIIEWIGTEWNGTELVPTGETEFYKWPYTAEELDELTGVILSTIDEVNAAYEQFLAQPDVSLVEESDVVEYSALEAEIARLSKRQDEIKERIGDQLKYSNQETFEHDLGTFYFRTTKTYQHPKDLKIGYRDYGLVLEDVEEIATAAATVKKMWELENEPVKVSKSISFRAKKQKA